MSRGSFTVALTGGIASGKSAVAARFAVLGASVIDADIVARELVVPGGEVLAEIVAAFGPRVCDANGQFDRGAMRERVFADPQLRRQLEAILHPRVRALLRERAASVAGPYALLVIPLLVESGHYTWVDRILLVDVPRDVQRARLLARDGVDAALADAMLDAQASRDERRAMADDMIENSGPRDGLDKHVRALHRRYVMLARSRSGG